MKQLAEIWLRREEIAEAIQSNCIIPAAGKQGLRMFNTFHLTEAELKATRNLWDKFSTVIEPEENFRVQRLKFTHMKQGKDKIIETFITRLKAKVAKCKFRDEMEKCERIIHTLISGIACTKTQEKLFAKETLTLIDAVKKAKADESSRIHMAQLSSAGQDTKTIQALTKMPSSSSLCNNCGGKHAHGKCPAYGTACNTCSRRGHWASVCRSASS